MNRKVRTALITSLVVIAISAALSLVFLVAAQWWPAASNAHIRWGDHSTQITGVFESGVFEFLIAWAAITLAILISVAAILFAFTITAIALGTVALFMALPMMVIAACVWLVVRHSRRNQSLHSATPSPQV
ncbi:MAG: hypothetical protein ABIZ64_04280 [Casimicrobium sp.]|jgi:hypothetical protein